MILLQTEFYLQNLDGYFCVGIDKQEEENLNKAMRDISNSNLFIDETPAIKVVDIRAKLNKLQSRFGEIGLVVIDYIGLITPDVKSKKDSSRSIELGAISAALTAVARDFKCPLLVLSQLNRSIEGGQDKVILKTCKVPQVGVIVLAKVNNTFVLHRIYKIQDNQIFLHGDGNLSGIEICSPEDIIGRVVRIKDAQGRSKRLSKGYVWRLLPTSFKKIFLKIYRKFLL